MSCLSCVKTDFSVWCSWSAGVLFIRERGHSTPLSIFSALTQTERDRVKAKGKQRFCCLIPDEYVRIKPLNHLFQKFCDSVEMVNVRSGSSVSLCNTGVCFSVALCKVKMC